MWWQRHGWVAEPFVVVAQSLSHVQLFTTPWTVARQASLSFTVSQSLLKLTSIESVMPSNHLIFCCPLLLLPSFFPSIRIFSNELALHIRWQKYIYTCVCVYTWMHAHVYTQSCPTIFNPSDHSPPGSSVHGISQARVLKGVALSSSRGSSWSSHWTHISCIDRQILYHWATWEASCCCWCLGTKLCPTLCDPMD